MEQILSMGTIFRLHYIGNYSFCAYTFVCVYLYVCMYKLEYMCVCMHIFVCENIISYMHTFVYLFFLCVYARMKVRDIHSQFAK